MIKAIETHYKGYRFRSRLEARWAVFLDALDLEWQYEVEGFELSNGERYLPDFLLPKFNGGIYVEVKPDELRWQDIERILKSKVGRFCRESYKRVLVVSGPPDCVPYHLVGNGETGNSSLHLLVNFCDRYLKPGTEFDTYRLPSNEYDWSAEANPIVWDAVCVARSARFEFGENG
jgi:hypothetical protein